MFEYRSGIGAGRNRLVALIASVAFVLCLGLATPLAHAASGGADSGVGGVAAVVPNDNCRDQIDVTNGSTAYTTIGATTDGPDEPQACPNSTDSINNDIWYRYTATCNGELTVDLCDSTFDTKVAVYAGCRQCPVVSPPLVCNDDFCGIQSVATLPVQQGSCYTIRIGGYFNNSVGTGIMKISCNTVVPMGACCGAGGQCIGTMSQAQCQSQSGVWHDGAACGTFVCPVPTPANDQCNDCIRLLTGVPYDGTTFGATGTDVSSCTPGDTKDVWHCWTADCTGRVRIGTCGSTFDTSLSIFDACGGNELICNDDGCGSPFVNSKIDLDVTEGTTYYVRVSGGHGETGNYHLVVDPCRNACCIDNGTCQVLLAAQCINGGGRPAGPGTLCLGDHNGNGIDDACDTCPNATITSATPPDGTLDARQPYAPKAPLPRQGIGSQGGPGVQAEPITIQLSPGVTGADHCFRLCETLGDGLLGFNNIGPVTDLGGGAYSIVLDRAITAGGVTTISYTGGGSFVQYTSHPANVNGDSSASPSDILDLIDNLNGVLVPPLSDPYGCDLDRSNVCAPADILTLIDLLNGANGWIPWNGSQRPVNNQCP